MKFGSKVVQISVNPKYRVKFLLKSKLIEFYTKHANTRVALEKWYHDVSALEWIQYQKKWVFIKFIGTHAQYDKVDATTIDQFKPRKKKLEGL